MTESSTLATGRQSYPSAECSVATHAGSFTVKLSANSRTTPGTSDTTVGRSSPGTCLISLHFLLAAAVGATF